MPQAGKKRQESAFSSLSLISWGCGMHLIAGELLDGPQMTKEVQCEGHRKGKVVGKTQGGNSEDLWVEDPKIMKSPVWVTRKTYHVGH